MVHYQTEQEAFWAGEFGDAYQQRNQGEGLLASNLALFSQMLARTHHLTSIMEVGANIGLNLRALAALKPQSALHAIEINPQAVTKLQQIEAIDSVFAGSILDYPVTQTFDLIFTKGVLIHLAPEVLSQVYQTLYQASRRYILLAEYYHPTPVEIAYRGHRHKMYKRDFAGEMLQQFPSLRLVDYGFCYRGDPNWPQDDVNWFLLEKG
ncbi:MAG: pseudaminic acid biosynthesis-associated methylase [Thiotrichales bacterium]|nr:pseudaminic acid biosynthesis-associated methylase [Thiotrichales bacterium]